MGEAARPLPPLTDFGAAVRDGLGKHGQKELPSNYLYDDLGSALFEAITLLPEYGLTRADERLLHRHAAEIVAPLPCPIRVAELGSGSGKKTRWLLEAIARRQDVVYCPIDVSPLSLMNCVAELSQLNRVHVSEIEASYLDGLSQAASHRSGRETLLVLFLGSTIGNFEAPEAMTLLEQIRKQMRTGDALLIGTDLEKPISQLTAAYDDPTGVTAAFNLNLLARMNRELGANFDLRQFRHRVRYDETHRRIEMHLVSQRRQRISIPAARIACTMVEGESIRTEHCHKFRLAELGGIARQAGFRQLRQWVDCEWPFAESLWIAVP
jgi:dimethylhistidine N-methyltransferase